jgi:molybdopterin biosynthesis enzyme MoaB
MYGLQKPNAMLSRGVAGVIGQSLIYTLPGSVKAVNEYMTEILTTLEHLVYMQYGVDVTPPELEATVVVTNSAAFLKAIVQ